MRQKLTKMATIMMRGLIKLPIQVEVQLDGIALLPYRMALETFLTNSKKLQVQGARTTTL